MQIDTMLERLHIRRYRGLRDLTVDGLGRINLIAGRNNVGKTTLLEAVYLLAKSGDPQVAIDYHVTRLPPRGTSATAISETFWKSLFFDLNVNGSLIVSGNHTSLGDMTLTVTLDRPVSTAVDRRAESGAPEGPPPGRSLRFTYCNRETGTIKSEALEAPDSVTFKNDKEPEVSFRPTFLLPGIRDAKARAYELSNLRRRKRGAWITEALRIFDSRLKSIEINSSSGEPLIWVDVGLSELIPAWALGAGVERIASLLIAAESAAGGVLLVDEMESGLHHAFLLDVWRVIGKAAKENNLQVIATTHSHECVQAAHAALDSADFRLHRLDAADDGIRCVTYTPDEIEAAIEFDLEVR